MTGQTKMNPDFYYQCEVCKVAIPSTFANPSLLAGQERKVDSGKKVEITYRCTDHLHFEEVPKAPTERKLTDAEIREIDGTLFGGFGAGSDDY